MKVLVTGSREFDNPKVIAYALDTAISAAQKAKYDIKIAQGGARGADSLVKEYCEKWNITCIEYKADWDKHGRAAGPIRNQEMLNDFKPNVLLAFIKHGAANIGTKDMINRALKGGMSVNIFPSNFGE